MPEWTQEQKSAIEDRGGMLLVSAAAGSGKTAVLTERVLRRVTDPENPIDITELLLVTPCGCAVSFSLCTARRSRPYTRCACRSRASRRPRSASRRISV